MWKTLSATVLVVLFGSPSFGQPAKPKTVSLLPVVDAKRDAVLGKWKTEKEGVSCGTSRHSMLLVPGYTPPDEYDIKATFTREKGGEDDGVGVVLNHMGKRFVWVAGRFRNRATGFDTFDGKSLDRHPSTDWKNVPTNGTKHTVLITVRNDSVVAFFDDEPVTVKTDWSDVRVPEKDFASGNSKAIGLISYGSPAVFHSLEVSIPAKIQDAK
jgi:hypothetical protein